MGTVQSSGTTQTNFRADFPSQQYSGTPQTQVFPVHTSGTATQTHVFPVQTQVVGQTTVIPVQTTVVRSRSNVRSSEAAIWISTTILRVISAMTSTGVLIAAAIAVLAINEVDDIANERGGEYGNAGSYRGAAGWLVFVGCVAIIFHVIMTSIQIVYFKCTVKKHFTQFAITNAIFCIIFAIALLAGGIANAIYAADNSELWTDDCFLEFAFDGDDFCESLERVRDAEIASVALSFISMLVFITLFFVMVCTGLVAASNNNQRWSSQPATAPSYGASTNPPKTNTVW